MATEHTTEASTEPEEPPIKKGKTGRISLITLDKQDLRKAATELGEAMRMLEWLESPEQKSLTKTERMQKISEAMAHVHLSSRFASEVLDRNDY